MEITVALNAKFVEGKVLLQHKIIIQNEQLLNSDVINVVGVGSCE